MSLKFVNSSRVPPGRARISHAVVHNGTVYVSGQVGRDPATGVARVGGTAEQTMQSLENIKSVLEAAGSAMDKVIKTNCYISNMEEFQAFNKVWESYFPENPPARLCIQAVLGPTFLIEIEAIAALD